RGAELVDHDPYRDAGAAGLAGRAIGDRLAAAEAAMGEQVVEIARALADQMRKHLPLLLARQIGAGGGRGQVELRRVARMGRHGVRIRWRWFNAVASLGMRRPSKGCAASSPVSQGL